MCLLQAQLIPSVRDHTTPQPLSRVFVDNLYFFLRKAEKPLGPAHTNHIEDFEVSINTSHTVNK